MKLQPNEMPNALLFALRLTEISRWGIVATSRQQSVGEHSYRVTMIAQALYDYVFTIPHNSNDRQLLTSFAMIHDILEVISGDLDAIFKLAVKSRYPDVFANTIGSMATQRLDAGPLAGTVATTERAVRGTFIEVIVKIADFLEALVYLDQYGTHSRHMGNVRDTILEHLWSRVEQFKQARYFGFDNAHWPRIEQFINLVLDSPGLQEKAQRGNQETPPEGNSLLGSGHEPAPRGRPQHPSADFGDDPLPRSRRSDSF